MVLKIVPIAYYHINLIHTSILSIKRGLIMQCNNCFLHIEDARKETRCSVCNSPLHIACSIKEDNKHYCDMCFTLKQEEKPTLTFDIPDVIRRSYIETYKSCPYKFYLTVIKGITDGDETIYTRLGIDLHGLFEKACHNPNYTMDNMTSDLNASWNGYKSLFENAEQEQKMLQRSKACISNFYNTLPTLPDKPLSTEETIVFDIGKGLPKISTTSDRIDFVDDELEISDWKTGQTMVGKRLSSDLQAPLYIYGVQQKYGMPVRKFTFYFLQNNKTRVFEKQQDGSYICTVRKRIYRIVPLNAVREAQSIFSQIKKGNFNIPTKSMYYTCKICHLFKNGNCKGADIQPWKLLQH